MSVLRQCELRDDPRRRQRRRSLPEPITPSPWAGTVTLLRFTHFAGPSLSAPSAEKERNPAPEIHRVLVALRRRERLAFELARVGSQCRPGTASALGLDLRARSGLEILAELSDLLARQREPHRY